jgi:hypothetical protein
MRYTVNLEGKGRVMGVGEAKIALAGDVVVSSGYFGRKSTGITMMTSYPNRWPWKV